VRLQMQIARAAGGFFHESKSQKKKSWMERGEPQIQMGTTKLGFAEKLAKG